MQMFEGKAFQAGAIARAKAVRWEWAWYVGRRVWSEQREGGEVGGDEVREAIKGARSSRGKII